MPFSNSRQLNSSSLSNFHYRRRGNNSKSSIDTLPLSRYEHSNDGKYVKRRSRSRNILIFGFAVLACTFTVSMLSHEQYDAAKKYEKYDAVIVGAGWAGISAAKVLLDGGVDNILVLEANNYIGGR